MLTRVLNLLALLSAAFLGFVLVTMPAHAKDAKVDGYEFHPEYVALEYTMQWQFVDNERELHAIAAAEGIRTHEDDGDPLMDNVHLYTNKTTGARRCVAVIVSPQRKIDAAVMLHVQLHCIYGRWHDAPTFGPRMN